MPDSALTMALAVSDPSVHKHLAKLAHSLDGVQLLAEGPADILVCQLSSAQGQDAARIRQGLSGMAREVFLVAENPSPDLLIKAMRLGIGECLPLPLERKDLAGAVARFRKRHEVVEATVGEPDGQVITVAGARSGVGATTLAVNLALELQQHHGSTALLDLRQTQGEAPLFLDLEYDYTWGDVAQNLSRLDGTYLQSVMARHASGLSVLASPGQEIMGPGDCAQTLERMFEELRRAFRYVVVDTDPGLETFGLKELELSDRVVLAMNLTLPCLAQAKRALELVRRVPGLEKRTRLVANRFLRDSDITPHDAEEILQKKIALALPDDYPGTVAAMNQGKPLALAAPRSPLLKPLGQLAANLAQNGAGRRSLFSAFKPSARKARKADAPDLGQGLSLEAS